METAKGSPDAKCLASFLRWAMANHWIEREDEDINSDPMWQAWKSAWYVCRSSSIYEVTKKIEKRCAIQSKPIPDEILKKAWISIGQGKLLAKKKMQSTFLRACLAYNQCVHIL